MLDNNLVARQQFMLKFFSDTEAVLEVDATNVFNYLNRQSSIQVLCPSFTAVLIREPTELCVCVCVCGCVCVAVASAT